MTNDPGNSPAFPKSISWLDVDLLIQDRIIFDCRRLPDDLELRQRLGELFWLAFAIREKVGISGLEALKEPQSEVK